MIRLAAGQKSVPVAAAAGKAPASLDREAGRGRPSRVPMYRKKADV